MIYIGLFLLSSVLTYALKVYAKKKAIFDIPNERSSHDTPTPRGGGLAIVTVFYLGLFYFKESIEPTLLYALLCALPVVLVSFLDDMFSLSSRVRFMVQSLSAVAALYFLGGVTSIDLIVFELHGWWVNILAFFSMLWLTNLYNFLDGIDGYAGSETVVVGLGLYIFFHQPLGLVLTAGSLGFLFFNWHPASIFMGDVGSATLGFLFSIFLFYDTGHGNIYIWLILLSLFWFDATLTLVRRYRNGEQVMKAHRKHAYQRLVQSGWRHDKVVWSAVIFNLIFFVLLYFVENILVVFIFNIVSLYAILKLIDARKSFI